MQEEEGKGFSDGEKKRRQLQQSELFACPFSILTCPTCRCPFKAPDLRRAIYYRPLHVRAELKFRRETFWREAIRQLHCAVQICIRKNHNFALILNSSISNFLEMFLLICEQLFFRHDVTCPSFTIDPSTVITHEIMICSYYEQNIQRRPISRTLNTTRPS